MRPVVLRRNAPVVSVNGGAGRLKYVILDPQHHGVTHLVVRHDGKDYLVPLEEVATVDHERIFLRGAWSRYGGRPFDREVFQVVRLPVARQKGGQDGLHHGATLLAAGEDEVHVAVPDAATGAPSAGPATPEGEGERR